MTATATEWTATASGWQTKGASVVYAPKHPMGRYLWVVPSSMAMGACQSLEAAMVAAQEAMEGKR